MKNKLTLSCKKRGSGILCAIDIYVMMQHSNIWYPSTTYSIIWTLLKNYLPIL